MITKFVLFSSPLILSAMGFDFDIRPDKEIYEELNNVEVIGDMIFAKSDSRMTNKDQINWPKGIVPYVISSNVTANLRPVIINATNYLNAYTCLRFRPAVATDTYWLRFLMEKTSNPNSVCASYVGWLNRKDQGVFLGPSCFFGSMVHELLHAIGFFHEHTRNDRDRYIRINKTNYASVKVAENYKLDKETCYPYERCSFSDYGVSYNYESIMHYCSSCGSKDYAYPVFITLNNTNAIGDPRKVGQRNGLSHGDWQMVNRKYGCKIGQQDVPDDIPENPIIQA